jgi:PAS domain S-box-containing protein
VPAPIEMAILDRRGTIIAVNQAWDDFCSANGGDPRRCGVGISYLDVCDSAGDALSRQVGAAIRAAVLGDLPAPMRLDVPCDGPDQPRTFNHLVSSRYGDDGRCLGAVVTLSLAREPAGTNGRRGLAAVTSVASADAGEEAVQQAVEGAGSPAEGDVGPLPVIGAGDLAALVEAAADGLMVTDSSGTIRYANRQVLALTGYRWAEVAGRPVELLVPRGSADRHARLRGTYLRAPRPRMMGEGATLALRRRDGVSLPVEISLSPATTDDGDVILIAIRDVSARRALEQRDLLVSEALDAIVDGVVVVDAETGRRLYANRAVLDRVGQTPEDLELIPLGALSTPQERAAIQAAVRAVTSGLAPQAVVDSRVLRRDGGTVPVEIVITYRAGHSAAENGRVIMVAHDTTERRAAEERMRLSEESFRTAFEQAPIGMVVVVLDAQGHRRIVRANATMSDLLGLSAPELIGHDFAEFTFPEDEDVDRAAAVQMAVGDQRRYGRHKRYRRPDGSCVWVEFRSTVIDLPDVPGRTVLAHMIDVTERHHVEVMRAQRAAMSEVVSQVTTAVLAGQSVDLTYRQVVNGVAWVFGADSVVLAFPDQDTGAFRLVAGVGPLSTRLRSGRVPVVDELARRLVSQEQTVLTHPPTDLPDGLAELIGPGAALRFGAEPGRVGLLTATRPVGGDPFTEAEFELLGVLARQLALGIELGLARADRQRLAVLEDRERLARDLHDTVIQDLIGIGMQLNAGLPAETDPGRADRAAQLIEQLDQTVRRLRAAVFELGAPPLGRGLADTVGAVCADAARALGHLPEVLLGGTPDAVPSQVASEVVAVLREGLSNVARHAHARQTSVTLTVEPGQRVTLLVEDDGVGLSGATQPGQGLANIERRAVGLGGRASVKRRSPRGTRMSWTVPL